MDLLVDLRSAGVVFTDFDGDWMLGSSLGEGTCEVVYQAAKKGAAGIQKKQDMLLK